MAEEVERKGPCPANDNGSPSGESLGPRIQRIAEAIGQQIARVQAKPPSAASDNARLSTPDLGRERLEEALRIICGDQMIWGSRGLGGKFFV